MARRKSKKNLSLLTILIILLITIFKIYFAPLLEQMPYEDKVISYLDRTESNVTDDADGLLKIHYIDVGQADSILLTLNDASMLIDAGNYDDNDKYIITDYLKNQGVTSLDYVIGTHPHDDHIGGLSSILENFDIETLIMPKVTHTTPAYQEILDFLDKTDKYVTTPKIGDTYDFSSAEFTILSCKNEDVEDLNSASVVIRLVFGEQSYIFCADAIKENEYEMMESGLTLKSNVIKIAHHGSTTSSSEKFLVAVDPEIAIITVGEGNSYGHPHEKILKRLDRLGIKTYRTDKNGTIVITSDGKTNQVEVEKGG